jgi:NADH-quinone oxidoreductase subunit E
MSEYSELIAPFKEVPGGVLEALHAVQEATRMIPPKALKEIATAFKMTDAEVYGVATFYDRFSFYEQGAYIIRVCRSAPCYIQDKEETMRRLEKILGIPMGATTEDGKFTLTWSECMGQCQVAPVIMFNAELLTPDEAERKILQIKEQTHDH